MSKLSILMISVLLLFHYTHRAQNISGIVNNYAAVSAVSGSGITVASVTAALAFNPGDRVLLIQMKGAVVDQNNGVIFGNITSMGGAGTYEFGTITSVSGAAITLASALTHTYNTSSGYVQLVRVPKYCAPVVSGTLTCAPWNTATKTGGVLAFEAGTLTLNAPIDASEKGFNGGSISTGTFLCDNGNFAAAAGANGGQKGEGVSAYITGFNGLKGKQANGGGGSQTGNSGSGGGGNGGAGGFGGNQYIDCDTTHDERGIGGLNISAAFSTLFMGGGGGGGFRDNGLTASKGGNGGGIIYIKANAIVSNNGSVISNGGNVTVVADAEGAGGGGAGGSIFIECANISGNLSVKTDGGKGGSNNNSQFVTFCHGPGGGGGGGVFAFSAASLPPGTTYSSLGGAAGTVNNPASTCFGTTYGAVPGNNGISLPGLPATPTNFTGPPNLSVSPNVTICTGETASITASGADYYSWSSVVLGSGISTIVVSPTVSTSYTVTGTSTNPGDCQVSLSTSVTVLTCVGIKNVSPDDDVFAIYPNPGNGAVFIECGTETTVSICDETGRLILERGVQKGKTALDLGAVAPGIYILKAFGLHGTKAVKLVKQSDQ